MKKSKQKQLFDAARREPQVQPPPHFAESVVVALRSDSTSHRVPSANAVWEILASLFPRSAVAAVAIMTVCAATEAWLNWHEESADMAQVAEQWFYYAE